MSIFTEITYTHYLILSAILFTLGVSGVLLRKNLIVIFMSVELMLNSVNLALVAISRYLENPNGVIFVFFIVTVAAAEAAVGLAIIISMYRHKPSINIDDVNELRG